MRARLGLALLAAALSCDNRACLARSDLFAGYRAELIAECCACLSARGTRAPGAACAEAVLDAAGDVSLPPDAGAAIPAGAPFPGDDLDDEVDGPDGALPAEVPCLCGSEASQCMSALELGERILVTGACVRQGITALDEVPCGIACNGVVNFDPIGQTPQATDP